MTTLNLAGYPTDDVRQNWDRCVPYELPRDLMAFFVHMGGQWLASPPGQVVTGQLWPALGGGVTTRNWTPPSSTVDINLTSLSRRERSSLARLLDEFARAHPNTGVIRTFVAAIVAEDAAVNPNSVPLFDV